MTNPAGSNLLPLLYEGSVKNLLGPIRIKGQSSIIFEYSDSYSVFDWGRMPDLLPNKGKALAILSADFFEKLRNPQTWKDYSSTLDSKNLKLNNRFGKEFDEIGEELQTFGLNTHYLGCVKTSHLQKDENIVILKKVDEMNDLFHLIAVKKVKVIKPKMTSILGRNVPDYSGLWKESCLPRLLPLEVVFRWSCPEGSSLRERVKADANYLSQIGYSDINIEADLSWKFPIVELFTKLESTDRVLSWSEGLAISGVTPLTIQEVILKTVWVSGLLRNWFSRLGIELADGKLEWALDENGKCILVDAVGPDELRLIKNGLQLSKEYLRSYYRQTKWYKDLIYAKNKALQKGVTDWKKFVTEAPPRLPQKELEIATQIYLSLANTLTEKTWFQNAWELEQLYSKF